MKKIIGFIALSTILIGCVPDTKTTTVDVVLSSTKQSAFVHTEEIRTFLVSGIKQFEGPDSILMSALKRILPGDTLFLEPTYSGIEETMRIFPFRYTFNHADRMLSLASDGFHAVVWKKVEYESTNFSGFLKKISILGFIVLMIAGGFIWCILFFLLPNRKARIVTCIVLSLVLYGLFNSIPFTLAGVSVGFLIAIPISIIIRIIKKKRKISIFDIKT